MMNAIGEALRRRDRLEMRAVEAVLSKVEPSKQRARRRARAVKSKKRSR